MTNLATYIPEEVVCLIGGILPIDGFVDGTFIEITKDLMPFTSVRSTDGVVSRIYHNDQTYTINITLYSGSQSNDVLTKFWQLDEISQKGKFPLFIKDGSGSDLFFSTNTWIETVPALMKSNGFEPRTWVLRSSQAVINIGGNSGESGIIQDLINIASGALPALEGIL
jgi:hypothetical protein